MATVNINKPPLASSSPSESTAPPPGYVDVATAAAESSKKQLAADPDPRILTKKGLVAPAVADMEAVPPPPSLATLRVLIAGDGDDAVNLVLTIIDWIADGKYIGNQQPYPLPHCDDAAAVQMYTCEIRKKTFALRKPGSSDEPKSLADMVAGTAAVSKLFGFKSDQLELVEVKNALNDKGERVTVEFIFLPQPAVLLALKNSHPYGYLDALFAILGLAYRDNGALYGLFYVTDQNELALTMFVDQFASLCPNLTYIMANYEPRTVIMDGGAYLDVRQRIAPIHALLDARNVTLTAIPVTTTRPLVDRPARTAFYYQQLGRVIDILIGFNRLDSAVSAHTAKLSMPPALEMWTPQALLDFLDAGSKLFNEKSQGYRQQRVAIDQRIKEFDQRIAKCTEAKATADAAIKRHETVKVYVPGLMVVVVGITSVAVNHFGPVVTVLAVCMLAAGTIGLMQVSERKAQQLKATRDKAEKQLPELATEKSKVGGMLPEVAVKIKAVANWQAMLELVRNACPTGKDVSVAALIPLRKPLISLCSRAASDSPTLNEDLADLAMAFLGTTGDDAKRVRSFLYSLATQLRQSRAESSSSAAVQRELAVEPLTEEPPEPAAARPVGKIVAMPVILRPGNDVPKIEEARQGPPVPDADYLGVTFEEIMSEHDHGLVIPELPPPLLVMPGLPPPLELVEPGPVDRAAKLSHQSQEADELL
ncbi:hypothetical protein GGF31_007344 [Allomyces arbusculus]|nr:hypothetical protein GGF31_007344 [Allomyces arbusculus]